MRTSTKIYIVVSLITIISLGIAIFLMNRSNPDSKIYKQRMQDFETKVEFYESILEADVLFYEKNKPNEAIELLKSLDTHEIDVDIVNTKIKSYQKFNQAIFQANQNRVEKPIDSEKEFSVLQKKMDSMSVLNRKFRDSLSNQITDLKEQLIQNKKISAGKDNIQVISFKGVRGNKIHYIGEVKDNKANGNGIGIWVTGSVYKGEWKNNIRHGQGFHEWPDGEKFDGTYVDGKRKGFGKYYWPNGERYEGQWVDDKRNGKGILFDPDGNIRFEGNWADDKPLKK